MRIAPLLLTLCFFAQSYAIRLHKSIGGGGKVCKISEQTDQGHAFYHISFSLNVGKCSTITNCNFFNMQNLVRKFIAKPVQTPPEGRVGKCQCNLKSLRSGESRTLKALSGAHAKAKLLDFIATDAEPCDRFRCWVKYNQFVYLTTRQSSEPGSNYRNVTENGNHWKFGCEEGVAEHPKTMKQLHRAAPKEMRLEMVKQAAKAGILPEELSGADELQADLEDRGDPAGLGDQQEFHDHQEVQDLSPDTMIADAKENTEVEVCATKDSTKCLQEFTHGSWGGWKCEDLTSSLYKRYCTSYAKDAQRCCPDSCNVSPVCTKEACNALSGKGECIYPNPATPVAVPAATLQRLQKSIDLMATIEGNIAKTLLHAEQFAGLTYIMRQGDAKKAIQGDWDVCEALLTNMRVLVMVLSGNVDNLLAFSAAAEITNAPPAALESFLLDAKAAMDVQFQIIDSFKGLIENAVQALDNFKRHDGEAADTIANNIMQQLGILKSAVKESRMGLSRAMAQMQIVSA